MVDEDWLEIVCDEIRQEVQGTFLENAQIIPVSSYTGEGIEQLRQAIFTMIDQKTQIKNLDVPFRIPVDRIFSVEGFGTVITGTLIEGTMKVGDPVTVYPSRIESRIRNLQVHSQDVQEAYAGQRVAVNLAGLKKTDLNKGDVIAVPDSMHTTMMIDIHLTVLKDCDREIRNATRLHLYHGAGHPVQDRPARPRQRGRRRKLLRAAAPGGGDRCQDRRPLCPALLLSGGNHRRRCHPRLQPF